GQTVLAKALDIATRRIPPRCCFFALFRGLRKHCTTAQSKTVDSVLRYRMRRFSPGLLVGFVGAASALATAASAPAMPVPAAPAYYAPAYHPVVYDWTGIYIGAHVGAGLLDDVVTT